MEAKTGACLPRGRGAAPEELPRAEQGQWIYGETGADTGVSVWVDYELHQNTSLVRKSINALCYFEIRAKAKLRYGDS